MNNIHHFLLPLFLLNISVNIFPKVDDYDTSFTKL
jgi:hypothetical protein